MDEKDLLHELMTNTDDEIKLTPKQAKILQAAMEIFAEKGYASTSTSEIAKRAGVAEGTIFRHYKTKKELLLSIVSPMITKFAIPFFADHFIKEVFEKKENESYEELLRTIIINRFNFVKRNQSLLKILLQEISFHEELQIKFKEIFIGKVYPRFTKLIKQYTEQGEISNDFNPNTVIRLMMTTVIGFIITRFVVMPNHEWDDEYEIEQTIRFIRNGLQ
ncbi:TetR/AcrR family transcriptional regulator [Piscibacillus halophilus]|uniref:Transcriptional regulator, TetR family n=1 Tax=Piscibacillus halophilus TaxID=571933 RepID=A0A1H9H1J9_9BACI|nr:TetR/AcrR family transcriptional regulator [Piscibacillus halophilus]SEQ56205.1 transcriptional regulator, TetR family [Piscibacillus halophilus]